jgi:hypothetical protein
MANRGLAVSDRAPILEATEIWKELANRCSRLRNAAHYAGTPPKANASRAVVTQLLNKFVDG